MHNYAGGLGVLAADILMSAADASKPLVGITLLYHEHDNPEYEYGFNYERYLTKRPESIEVEIEGRKVKVAIWQKEIIGRQDHIVPIYFLSTHLPENERWDRDLTKHLYSLDKYTRLGQEIVLGVGGVRALRALGYENVENYHLNEGHSAFVVLELLKQYNYDKDKVRKLVTFTTHTPIPAGHDYFDYGLSGNTLRDLMTWDIREIAGRDNLSMTELAMSMSKSTNSVSLRHRSVCEKMFPGKSIKNVTNGIYAPRWTGDHMAELYSRILPGWQENPIVFSETSKRITDEDILTAKAKEKEELVHWINFNKAFFAVSNVSEEDRLERDVLTIGFGRRFVPYKRPDLVFRDIDRLASLGERKLQFVFANRCHRDDFYCNDLWGKLRNYADALRGKVKIVLIPDYDLRIAKRLVSGCDIWLNTPIAPMEASGTSGMKAALNGALNISTRDGWWIEGLEREPKSGWGFGSVDDISEGIERDAREAGELIYSLEAASKIYYEDKKDWAERMKRAIALISYFNTTRVVAEYENTIWNS
jgi:alpha-glucan phosphorylase-like protein